jgi:hypothetical protein
VRRTPDPYRRAIRGQLMRRTYERGVSARSLAVSAALCRTRNGGAHKETRYDYDS